MNKSELVKTIKAAGNLAGLIREEEFYSNFTEFREAVVKDLKFVKNLATSEGYNFSDCLRIYRNAYRETKRLAELLGKTR